MLETDRLILRRLEDTDADAIYQMRSDAELMRYIREPQKRRETEKWIRLVSSRWEKDKMGFCAVVEKNSEKLIGWCGVWRLSETGEVEIGYAIAKQFWNQGLATEAAKAILEYAFANIETDRITAVADPENVSSRRVMEKLGMKYVRTDDFYERQLTQYAINSQDFLARKDGKPDGFHSA